MTVKTRAELLAENAADFPDNLTGLISPADLREQMNDVADSARLKEDIPTMFDRGSLLYPSMGIGQGTMPNLDPSDDSAYNIAIGWHAGNALTTNIGSIAIGGEALPVCTTGTINIAIGMYSAWSLTGGRANLSIGNQSMMFNVGGSDNTALGHFTLELTGGYNNTAVGKHCLGNLITGDSNTAIGDDAGRLSIEEGNGNILIGKSADIDGPISNNQIVIGTGVVGLGDDICTIGMGFNKLSVNLDGADTSWSAVSDERLKTNVEDCSTGLAFIEALRPVTYDWSDPNRGAPGKRYVGFVAQEVKAAIDNNSGLPNGQHLWSEHRDGTQALAPGALIPILVNAIKELATEVATLKARR